MFHLVLIYLVVRSSSSRAGHLSSARCRPPGGSPRCAPQRCAKEGKDLSVCVVEKGAEVGAPAILPAPMQLWSALSSEHSMGLPAACAVC